MPDFRNRVFYSFVVMCYMQQENNKETAESASTTGVHQAFPIATYCPDHGLALYTLNTANPTVRAVVRQSVSDIAAIDGTPASFAHSP
eukprot:IDg11763t1